MGKLDCSVLLPVYAKDNESHLRLSLQSLVMQTVKPREVVLVIDGPIPESLNSVVREYQRVLPLNPVFLKENVGLGAALNEGLACARYPIVMRMDADDICHERRVEEQLSFLELHPEVDILGSYAVEVSYSGVKRGERKVPDTHAEIVSALWTCPLIHPTVMYRKDKILSVGGYNPSLRRRQDYELWFRCAKGGLVFENLRKPLLFYRFDSGSHKKQPVRLAFQQGMIGYKGSRYIGLSLWKALACFAPLLRSLLPSKLQHAVYRLMKYMDPRQA